MGKCATTIKFLTWLVNRTPSARRQLANWNRVVQFSLTGEKPFYVATSDGRMKYGFGRAENPHLVFVSGSEEFFEVMIGRTKFDQGFSKGIYTVQGSIVDAVRLMRIAELALESHPTLGSLLKRVSTVML